MNKTLCILLSILLLLSCRDERAVVTYDEGEDITLSCTFTVSDAASGTRADKDAQIESMRVLIFDGNGSYLDEAKVYPGDHSSYPGGHDDNDANNFDNKDGYFKVHFHTKTTTNPVIYHFVAGYDMTATHTDEITMAMRTQISNPDRQVYWQRVRMKEVKKETKFNNLTLIRNVARISVSVDDIPYFEYEGFALCRAVKTGTMAPLNYNAGYKPEGKNHFAEYTDSSGVLASYSDLVETQKYVGCRPIGSEVDMRVPSEEDFTKEAKNVFENEWTEDEGTFIMIKGRYKGYVCYYKVELGRSDKSHYHILRNFDYRIKITELRNRGYTEARECFESAAGNMVEHEDTPDGTNPMLYMSSDNFYLVDDGIHDGHAVFEFKYLYNDDIKFIVDNADIRKGETGGKYEKLVYDSDSKKYVNPNQEIFLKSLKLEKSEYGRMRCTVDFKKYNDYNFITPDGKKDLISQILRIVPDKRDGFYPKNIYKINFVKFPPLDPYCEFRASGDASSLNIWLNLRGGLYTGNGFSGDKDFDNLKPLERNAWPAYTILSQLPKYFPIEFEIEFDDNRIVSDQLDAHFNSQTGRGSYRFQLTYDDYMSAEKPLAGVVLNFHMTNPDNCKKGFILRCDKFFKPLLRFGDDGKFVPAE